MWGTVRKVTSSERALNVTRARRELLVQLRSTRLPYIAASRIGTGAGCRSSPGIPLCSVRCRPEMAGMRSPGTTIPTMFSGSAAEMVINSGAACSPWLSSSRRNSRNDSTATGSANCSPIKPAMNRPPRISPRSSRRRRATCNSRQRGRPVSRASSSRKTTP